MKSLFLITSLVFSIYSLANAEVKDEQTHTK